MDVLLTIVNAQIGLVRLDDLVVFCQTRDEPIEQVIQVLPLLNDAGVTLEMKKSEFFIYHIEYLGHVSPLGRLPLSTRPIDAVCRLQFPTFEHISDHYRVL